MCHLILALPLLALPVFWLLPLPAAVPLYLLIAGVAVATYFYAFSAARRPVEIGRERLFGAGGTVVSVAPLQVKVDGEIWMARSSDVFAVGDAVDVDGVDGLTLQVRCAASAAGLPPEGVQSG